jgi:hypothetical protein
MYPVTKDDKLADNYTGLQGFLVFDAVGGSIGFGLDRITTKIAALTSGGIGHEPVYVGFVGPGMLTVTVRGDVIASSPVDSILAAIRAVSGPMGCLLIVKNYTGDRLNLGLAAEHSIFFSLKTVCSHIVYCSHSKKKSNNMVIGSVLIFYDLGKILCPEPLLNKLNILSDEGCNRLLGELSA